MFFFFFFNFIFCCCCCSVTKSSPTLQPLGLQHSRHPCLSPSPGVCPSSCPLNQWCHPTISSSCRPLLLMPSLFPSIRVFSSKLAVCIRWPKYWSFSFSISPSNGYLFLTFRPVTYLELIFMYGVKDLNLSFCIWLSNFQHHLLERLSFSQWIVLGAFVKNELTVHIRVHFWILWYLYLPPSGKLFLFYLNKESSCFSPFSMILVYVFCRFFFFCHGEEVPLTS